MATLRQNIVIRPSELRTSVLETALDMGIRNETVAKWIFDSVAEEEEDEEVSIWISYIIYHKCDFYSKYKITMSSPSLTTASSAPSITSSTRQATSIMSYESSIANSTISTPFHIEIRDHHTADSLISGSLSASVASNLSPQSPLSLSPSPSKKPKWQGLKVRKQPEIEIPEIKMLEEKKIRPVEFKVSKKKGIKSEDDIKLEAAPSKKRTKSSKSKPVAGPGDDAMGYESEGQVLSPKKRKENEKKLRSIGRTVSNNTPSRDEQDQGYASDGAALTPSKKKKSFFRFERKTPSIPDLRSSSSHITNTRSPSKPSTPPMPIMPLPIAERFARMRVGDDADFVRGPFVSISVTPEASTNPPNDSTLTTDIWNDAVLLGSGSEEKKNKVESNDNASTISSIGADTRSMISSTSVIESVGSRNRSEESPSSSNPTLAAPTPWLSRKPSKRKITPADISLPTTHFLDTRKASPSTQSSASPASNHSFLTSSSGRSFFMVDPETSPSIPSSIPVDSNNLTSLSQSSIQARHDDSSRGRTIRPTLTVVPPRDTMPPSHSQRSPENDQRLQTNNSAPASLLAYYGLPPPSSPPLGPLPQTPSPSSIAASNLNQTNTSHRRLSPLRHPFSRPSRSRSPMAQNRISREAEKERIGLYAQPIPTIRRGREAPFPTEPILPAEDSYNLSQKSVVSMLAPQHNRISSARSPSRERAKASLRPSFETPNDRTSDEDWPDINAPRRSDDAYDVDDDASFYTSDDRTASRSTLIFFEEDPRSSIYSKASVLNPERSAEIRKRFLKRTAALFGSDGRELEDEIPPVPPLPAGLALGYDVPHDPFGRY